MLLMDRDYLLPMRLKSGRHISNMTGAEAPYFVFVSDVKELEDPDFTSFEYIPVSYTHLDVYKRQLQQLQGLSL